MVSPDNGVTWINLGALTEWKLMVEKIIKERVFDNAKMEPKIKIGEVILSCNLQELALDKMQTIDGFANYSTVDGTEQTVTGEAHGVGWVVGEPFKLKNSNGDGTENGSVVMKENGTALVDGTDYEVYIHNGETFILPLTAQTGAITGDYTYTPLERKEQIFSDINKFMALNQFKFVNEDEDGKEFGIEFYRGYNRAGVEMTFQPDEWEENMSCAIEIKAFPTSDNKLYRLFDEQDV